MAITVYRPMAAVALGQDEPVALGPVRARRVGSAARGSTARPAGPSRTAARRRGPAPRARRVSMTQEAPAPGERLEVGVRSAPGRRPEPPHSPISPSRRGRAALSRYSRLAPGDVLRVARGRCPAPGRTSRRSRAPAAPRRTSGNLGDPLTQRREDEGLERRAEAPLLGLRPGQHLAVDVLEVDVPHPVAVACRASRGCCRRRRRGARCPGTSPPWPGRSRRAAGPSRPGSRRRCPTWLWNTTRMPSGARSSARSWRPAARFRHCSSVRPRASSTWPASPRRRSSPASAAISSLPPVAWSRRAIAMALAISASWRSASRKPRPTNAPDHVEAAARRAPP